MKKILLAFVVACGFVGVAMADNVSTVVADGVVGTEDKAYRVKAVIFTCQSYVDSPTGVAFAQRHNCYANLRNGDDATWGGDNGDQPLLHFQASITNPTITINYQDLVNRGTTVSGVLFDSGIYYDEVTGSTTATIVYESK